MLQRGSANVVAILVQDLLWIASLFVDVCCSREVVACAKPRSSVKLSTEEVRLPKEWYNEDGRKPSEIVELLHRDRSTITRLLVLKRNTAKTPAQKSLPRPKSTLWQAIRRIYVESQPRISSHCRRRQEAVGVGV